MLDLNRKVDFELSLCRFMGYFSFVLVGVLLLRFRSVVRGWSVGFWGLGVEVWAVGLEIRDFS